MLNANLAVLSEILLFFLNIPWMVRRLWLISRVMNKLVFTVFVSVLFLLFWRKESSKIFITWISPSADILKYVKDI